LSLLLAQHEPRICACVAYAPACDVEKRLEEVTSNFAMRQMFPGLVGFIKQSSPKTHVAEFQCPVFLFHALDDGNVPASDSRTFAAALRSAGKQVTLRTVPFGDHYQSMIDKGIPQAIVWLQRERGAVGGEISKPTSTPTMPPSITPPVMAQPPNTPFPTNPLPTSRPFSPPPVPRGPDPSKLFGRPPTGIGGPRVNKPVVVLSVLGFTGEGDKTAAVRKAMTGIGWADANASFFDAKANEIVVPVRVTTGSTGIAKARLQRAGFKIGLTRYRSQGR
jgi:hypothetical protein